MDIWGKGGLFERAVANKMDARSAEAERNRGAVGSEMLNARANMLNADTNRIDAGNRYDIGLRADAVNRMNADTSRFSQETQRLISGGGVPVSESEASNLGLRSFNPISDRSFASFTQQRNAAIPSLGPRPEASATPAQPASRMGMFSSSVGDSTRPNSFSDRPFGMMNGGVALKPKMVKQPGYMHGGKVKGYKAGGKIGDVAKDDGTDKVDVAAREGEYFINPETVAHIGGGNYEQGVRNLNALVREATGKEPGPVPVGKGGKQGLNLSGATVDPAELRREYRNVVGETRLPPRGGSPAPAPGPTVYVDRTGVASTDPNYGLAREAAAQRQAAEVAAARAAAPSTMQRAAQGVADAVGASDVAKNTGRLVDATSSGAQMAESLRKSKMGLGLGLVGTAMGANDAVQGLRKGDYVGATLGAADALASAAPFVPAMAAGVPAALVYGAGRGGAELGKQIYNNLSEDTRDTIGGTINSAVRNIGKVFGRDWGVDDSALLMQKAQDTANASRAAAAPKPAAAKPDNKNPYEEENNRKLAAAAAEAAKPQSLRDMMMARLGGIDAYDGPFASMVQRGMQGERGKLIDALTKLEEQSMQSDAARGAAGAKALQQARENADKRIAERYQIPKFDKEGRITGYEKDPNAANALRDFAAQMFADGSGRPVDFYALTPEQQDKVFHAYDINSRGTRRLNRRLAQEGGIGARTSMLPRINGNSLRADGEISIGDIFDPNISIDDWITSWGLNKLEKQVLRDPVTNQRVSARHVLTNEDGTIDQDLIEQMNRANQKAR